MEIREFSVMEFIITKMIQKIVIIKFNGQTRMNFQWKLFTCARTHSNKNVKNPFKNWRRHLLTSSIIYECTSACMKASRYIVSAYTAYDFIHILNRDRPACERYEIKTLMCCVCVDCSYEIVARVRIRLDVKWVKQRIQTVYCFVYAKCATNKWFNFFFGHLGEFRWIWIKSYFRQ